MLTEKLGIKYIYSSGQMWLNFNPSTLSWYILAYSPQPILSASVATGVAEAHVWTEGSSLMNYSSSQALSDGTLNYHLRMDILLFWENFWKWLG